MFKLVRSKGYVNSNVVVCEKALQGWKKLNSERKRYSDWSIPPIVTPTQDELLNSVFLLKRTCKNYEENLKVSSQPFTKTEIKWTPNRKEAPSWSSGWLVLNARQRNESWRVFGTMLTSWRMSCQVVSGLKWAAWFLFRSIFNHDST